MEIQTATSNTARGSLAFYQWLYGFFSIIVALKVDWKRFKENQNHTVVGSTDVKSIFIALNILKNMIMFSPQGPTFSKKYSNL